jgi:hypothetical protein
LDSAGVIGSPYLRQASARVGQPALRANQLAIDGAVGVAGQLGHLPAAAAGNSKTEDLSLPRAKPRRPDLFSGNDQLEATVGPEHWIGGALGNLLQGDGSPVRRCSFIASRTAVVRSHANAAARGG